MGDILCYLQLYSATSLAAYEKLIRINFSDRVFDLVITLLDVYEYLIMAIKLEKL